MKVSPQASPGFLPPLECRSRPQEKPCQQGNFQRSDEEGTDDGRSKASTLDCGSTRSEGEEMSEVGVREKGTSKRKILRILLFAVLMSLPAITSAFTIVVFSNLLFISEAQFLQLSPPLYTNSLRLLSSTADGQDSKLTASINGLQLSLRGYNPLFFPLGLQAEKIEVFFRASQGALDIVQRKLRKTIDQGFDSEEAIPEEKNHLPKQGIKKTQASVPQQAHQQKKSEGDEVQPDTRGKESFGRSFKATVAFDTEILDKRISDKQREILLPSEVERMKQRRRRLSSHPEGSFPIPGVHSFSSNKGSNKPSSASRFTDPYEQDAQRSKNHVLSGAEIDTGNALFKKELSEDNHSEEEEDDEEEDFLYDVGDGIPDELWQQPSYIPGRQLHPLQVNAITAEREPREALVRYYEHSRSASSNQVQRGEPGWNRSQRGDHAGVVNEIPRAKKIDSGEKDHEEELSLDLNTDPILVQDLLDSLIPLRSNTEHVLPDAILSKSPRVDEMISKEQRKKFFPNGFNTTPPSSSINNLLPSNFFTDTPEISTSSSFSGSDNRPVSFSPLQIQNPSLISFSSYIQAWNASNPINQDVSTHEQRNQQTPKTQATEDLTVPLPQWRKLFNVDHVKPPQSFPPDKKHAFDNDVERKKTSHSSTEFKVHPRQHLDEPLHISAVESWLLRKGEDIQDTPALELIVTCLHEGFLQLEVQISEPCLQIAGGTIFSRKVRPIRSQSVLVPCEYLESPEIGRR
ncbi:hypothetical protein CSUI_002436 [Cystoisospora suis]|uniref:Transmembrane protein n=1 Tax=Cystoisospora suis TaxID=483139 RepID=A0A2C6L9B5_9APIC|nr:hypothetical protein CSUI_002436 [Cystoisospora suis]